MDHIIDDRTPSKQLPLPHPDNWQEDDVLRLRQALYEIDALLAQVSDLVVELIDDNASSADRTLSAHKILALLQERQAAHANLAALSALAGQANHLAYFAAEGMALAVLTDAARVLLAATTPTEQRNAIGLGAAAVRAVMSGPADSALTALVPRGFGWALRDKQSTTAAAAGAVALDLASACLFDLTLTGAATLALANLPEVPAGEVHSIVVRVRQGATAYALTWWAGITWLAAATPSAPTANRIAEYVLSWDGAGWIGRKGASN